jgi:hypothetical protein
MFNDRPIEDASLKEALDLIVHTINYYDLAGGVFLVKGAEWCYGYQMPATWNAHIDDPSTPMGFRIRAREAELGRDRAGELLLGSAQVLTSMQDFGNQTRLWAGDMIKLLRKAGLHIDHTPFNGQRLPRLEGLDLR